MICTHWPSHCNWAVFLAHFERNPAEVERLASELIELSTRHNFAFWLAVGTVFRGWARSASGDTAEGIRVDRARNRGLSGNRLRCWRPVVLALKAEALHLADRTSEALEAIREAEALAERLEERWWCAELHRLRGVFLAAIGADETEIETAFALPSESQGSRSRFRWRNARKQPTRDIITKRRKRTGNTVFSCLFRD